VDNSGLRHLGLVDKALLTCGQFTFAFDHLISRSLEGGSESVVHTGSPRESVNLLLIVVILLKSLFLLYIPPSFMWMSTPGYRFRSWKYLSSSLTTLWGERMVLVLRDIFSREGSLGFFRIPTLVRSLGNHMPHFVDLKNREIPGLCRCRLL
jgi:hypothetical protein